MNIGEQLTALENHIYLFAKTQFEVNDIPPTVGKMIMECVYSKFQEQAIAQMIANQTIVEKPENPITETKTGSVIELMKEFYGAGKKEDNVGTEDYTAQEG